MNMKLARRLRRQARRQFWLGNIDLETRDKVYAVTYNETAMDEVEKKIKQFSPWGDGAGLIGADWSTYFAVVWDWVKEYWPQILKIILTIAPLLLMEENDDYS
jgi:hypothetical protein